MTVATVIPFGHKNERPLTEQGCRFPISSLSVSTTNRVFELGEHACFLTMLNRTVVQQILDVARSILKLRKENGSVEVIGVGAGSSARILNAVRSIYGDRLAELDITFSPQIAGGPIAFLRAVEGSEDDPKAFEGYLSKIKNRAAYVLGVTCGLSASCVFGALEWARSRIEEDGRRSLAAGIFGTNDIQLAPTRAIAGVETGGARAFLLKYVDMSWVQRLLPKRLAESLIIDKADYAFLQIIRPQNVPDPISGSSRLNGGTLTMIALEVICECLLKGAEEPPDSKLVESLIEERHQSWHRVREDLSAEIEEGARKFTEALNKGGRIFYVTKKPKFAPIAALDMSELKPTFGEFSVFCKTEEGWQGILDGSPYHGQHNQLESEASLMLNRTSADEFTGNDLVIAIGEGLGDELFGEATIHRIAVDKAITPLELKLALNSISTIGETQYGRAISVGNQTYMSYFQMSNQKLLERAIYMVNQLSGLSIEESLKVVARVVLGEHNELLSSDEATIKAEILKLYVGTADKSELKFNVPISILHGMDIPIEEARLIVQKPSEFMSRIRRWRGDPDIDQIEEHVIREFRELSENW